jgi:hypothetical protein
MPTPRAIDADRLRAAPARRRRQVGHALRLWIGLTLGGVVVLAGLVIWHLVRRGRRMRERLGPPREVLWPTLDARAGSQEPADGAQI